MIAVYYAIPNPVSQQVALLSYNTNFSLIWLKPRYFATDVISQSSFSGNRRTQYVPHLQYRQQTVHISTTLLLPFHITPEYSNIQWCTNHWQDSNRNSQEPTPRSQNHSFLLLKHNRKLVTVASKTTRHNCGSQRCQATAAQKSWHFQPMCIAGKKISWRASHSVKLAIITSTSQL